MNDYNEIMNSWTVINVSMEIIYIMKNSKKNIYTGNGKAIKSYTKKQVN